MLAHSRDESVPSLVIGRDLLLVIREQHRFALRAHEHFVLRNFEVVHVNRFAVLASGVQRRFVDHVGQVGARESRSTASEDRQIYIISDGNLAGVNAQNLFASAYVRTRHNDSAIEAARAQQRRIKNVGTVGCGDQDHPFVGFEAVHFDQQLIERLFALIVPAAEARATVAAYSVDFVDENNAGRVLFALLKQIADAARAYADKHFHEVRTGDGEERDVSFPGDRAGQQGLTRSWRTYEQHAFGNASTELLEFLRLAQKFNDFFQFFLGFVHAGHVFKRDLLLLHREQTRATLAKRERLVSTRLHLANHDEP